MIHFFPFLVAFQRRASIVREIRATSKCSQRFGFAQTQSEQLFLPVQKKMLKTCTKWLLGEKILWFGRLCAVQGGKTAVLCPRTPTPLPRLHSPFASHHNHDECQHAQSLDGRWNYAGWFITTAATTAIAARFFCSGNLEMSASSFLFLVFYHV